MIKKGGFRMKLKNSVTIELTNADGPTYKEDNA